jgi:hypothetical protein
VGNGHHAPVEKAEGYETIFPISKAIVPNRDGRSRKDLATIGEVDGVLDNVELTFLFVPLEYHARIPDVVTFGVTRIDFQVSRGQGTWASILFAAKRCGLGDSSGFV